MYRKNLVKKRKVKIVEQTVNFRFWNGGVEYICSIVAPVSIPKYRLKEAFDKTFVGLKKSEISTLQSYTSFKQLSPDITYTIKPVKEEVNV